MLLSSIASAKSKFDRGLSVKRTPGRVNDSSHRSMESRYGAPSHIGDYCSLAICFQFLLSTFASSKKSKWWVVQSVNWSWRRLVHGTRRRALNRSRGRTFNGTRRRTFNRTRRRTLNRTGGRVVHRTGRRTIHRARWRTLDGPRWRTVNWTRRWVINWPLRWPLNRTCLLRSKRLAHGTFSRDNFPWATVGALIALPCKQSVFGA